MTQDLSAVAWPVRTARLSIRRATAADADATWAFRRVPGVDHWLSTATGDLASYAEGFVDPERLAKTLIIERDGEVIGDLMLAIGDPWSQHEVVDQAAGTQAELGWVLHPDHAGHGYATEAVAELFRICFEDLGLRRVIALCFADNVASWRLMERLGMRREEHTVRDSLHRSGDWLDGYGYALLADEWRSRT